ncbi:predicted protein [Sclerotinia sclerotiorum 1980 UF-70]|uniref:Uncharacterized protein n=1 Tax=Sclerotinia sclerotiorum (strain ATCC 18683 / 1980 / Ss-1) TaxID=665079 RepID=A7EE06_SCLS1|nr:predicted protein [Sclerotinia sclerotiorum 1980 UF-70]EDO01072.1 predicted protein [Sclerotinia sclerotiorum 1980 UF-70]
MSEFDIDQLSASSTDNLRSSNEIKIGKHLTQKPKFSESHNELRSTGTLLSLLIPGTRKMSNIKPISLIV